ncbi:hypothetical protein SBD_7856 [Streptomyces bottropensis ATCC 25435]|uniref:Uncharacterized protein n=1 Tax=Streptomyces bottropensis ATCC 25435 TaxID=1054862 RepID=M3EQ31_9ACTN|nr:hypothetical protein SBD_7856 [Streptomyces bottropensis ATCC 25435]
MRRRVGSGAGPVGGAVAWFLAASAWSEAIPSGGSTRANPGGASWGLRATRSSTSI